MFSLLNLARFQFAMTTIFHFLFVPLSIGLALAVAIMETLYVVKKDSLYKDMAKFWGKIFLLGFAVGVVTGIIQEFQFGMNWSAYSRFVGDIFGAPLAIEALLAFFMESTFIGLWSFGWERFSKKVHLVFIWLVVLGSTLSAFWILLANAFMQHPTGFTYNQTIGRAELTDFGALLTSPQTWYEFLHVLFAAIVTAAFVIAGLSAWQLLRKKNIKFYLKSIQLGFIMGMIGAVLVIGAGDLQTRALIEDQPMKFAATEALYEHSEDPASWSVIAGIDTKEKKKNWSIELPYLLSILGHHRLDGSFKGMKQINAELQEKYSQDTGIKDFYVPVKTLFWSFRFMIGFGFFLILLAIVGLLLKKSDVLLKQKWFLVIVGCCTFAPFIANTSGWLITELGRYPWTVYGLFTIADSVSPNVSVGQLLFSNIVYFLLFATLAVVLIYLIRRELHKGPYAETRRSKQKAELDPFSKEAFEK